MIKPLIETVYQCRIKFDSSVLEKSEQIIEFIEKKCGLDIDLNDQSEYCWYYRFVLESENKSKLTKAANSIYAYINRFKNVSILE